MNFGSELIHQTIKCAEGRQIYRCHLQRLNRAIDEVGRIAHGFGGFESCFGDQLLGQVSIGRDRNMFPDRRLIG